MKKNQNKSFPFSFGRRNIKLQLFMLLVISLLSGCKDIDDGSWPFPDSKGDYSINAKYQSIRSYPEGGGIFIINLTPENGFFGSVKLKLEADPSLQAVLSRNSIDPIHKIVEITIQPQSTAEIKKYNIILIATNGRKETRILLEVDMFEWQNGESETPLMKRDEFKDWIVAMYPQYSKIFEQRGSLYHTYPEILIVEHFTFLTDDYEVRFCYHVMIPPYDWSMIQIRNRHSLNAEFAARRETDGSIKQIPVADYPIMLNY